MSAPQASFLTALLASGLASYLLSHRPPLQTRLILLLLCVELSTPKFLLKSLGLLYGEGPLRRDPSSFQLLLL